MIGIEKVLSFPDQNQTLTKGRTMTTLNLLILAMVVVYLMILLLAYLMLRRIGVTIDALVWITDKLHDDLSKLIGDGAPTMGKDFLDPRGRRTHVG